MNEQFNQEEQEAPQEFDDGDASTETDSNPSLFALAILIGALGLSLADSVPGGATETIGFLAGLALGIVAIAITTNIRGVRPSLGTDAANSTERLTQCPYCGDTIAVRVLRRRQSEDGTRSDDNG